MILGKKINLVNLDTGPYITGGIELPKSCISLFDINTKIGYGHQNLFVILSFGTKL